MLRMRLLVLTALVLGPCGRALAQGWNFARLADPIDDAQEAWALFEASRANVQELRQARLEAVRGWYRVRMDELEAGKTTVHILLTPSEKLMEIERSDAVRPLDRAAARERHWKRLLKIEDILQTRFRDGKASSSELLMARYFRLGAQIEMLRDLAGLGLAGLGGWSDLDERQSDAGELARLAFEALRIRSEDLPRARLAAAREQASAEYNDLIAGKTLAEVLMDSEARALEAERALLDNDADLVSFAESRWLLARLFEAILQTRYEAGKASTGEVAECRFRRLQAEYALSQALARRHTGGKRLPSRLMLWNDQDERQPKFKQELATVKRDRNPTNIAKAMVETARKMFRGRFEELLAGKTSVDLLLDASTGWLEAELALSSGRADRIRAHEQAWRRNLLVERILETRFRVGKAWRGELHQARYMRLDAQLSLEMAKAERVKDE